MICPNCDKEIEKKDMAIYEWKYCSVGECKIIIQWYCPNCGWLLLKENK